MSRWYAVLAVLAVVIAAGYVLADSDDSDAAVEDYSFRFTIVNDQGDVMPAGAVIISDANGHKCTCTYNPTSEEYRVTGQLDFSSDVTLKVSYKGYTIKQLIGLTASDTDDSYTITSASLASAFTETAGVYRFNEDIVIVETKMTFFVFEAGKETGPIPSGTAVSITDANGNVTTSSVSSTGLVTISIGGYMDKMKMTIDYPGHTAIPGIVFRNVDSNGVITFSLRETFEVNDSSPQTISINPEETLEGGKVVLRTYEISNSMPIYMVSSQGSLTIKVTPTTGSTGLIDATVTLFDALTGIEKDSKDTDSNGLVTFTVDTGSYFCVVSVSGFENYDSRADSSLPNDGIFNVGIEKKAVTVSMTEKTSATFFGMNMGHTLMLIGVVIGLILALLSYMLYTRRFRSELSEEGL